MINNLKQKAASALENTPIPVDAVLGLLRKSKSPMKAEDIAKEAGLDKSLIDKALAMLTRSGQVTCPETGCYTVK